MTAFDTDPSIRWLFCMTHPDDEISICAWIKRLTDAGAEVWISWTHSTPRRQAEAEHLSESLGVPMSRLFFHGALDGGVPLEMVELLPEFRRMMQRVQPTRVACGAFEQGHIDHDATNCLVHHSFHGPVFEIPFYYSYLTRLPRVNRFEDPAGSEVLALGPNEMKFKTAYARGFPSQKIWRNMIFADLRARLTGDGPLRATERMRLQGEIRYDRPNHGAALAARIEKSARWQEWMGAYREFSAACLSGL